MDKKIFKIDFNGIIGTGVLLKRFEGGYGIIVTACHCMSKVSVDNQYNHFYDNISIGHGIEVIYVWKSDKKDDIAILIIKFREEPIVSHDDWKISEDIHTDTFSADIQGYPAAKESAKPDFQCCISQISYDANQKIYIGKLQDLTDPEKSLYMQGMSGSPVYDKESGELYGIYLGAQEEEYRYDECRVVPIQNVIMLARDNDLIYYKRFSYNEGIGLYDKENRFGYGDDQQGLLNLYKPRQLSFLLLGRSGQGKSSFIKSFLKHSVQIASTGEGRTTRVNCEYNIYYSYDAYNKENKRDYIQINFLNKDKFIKIRLRQIEKKLQQIDRSCTVKELYNILCIITGFFDITEFGSEAVSEVDAIFESIFIDSGNTIKSEMFGEESAPEKEVKEEQPDTLYEYAENFYGQVFEKLGGEDFFKNRRLELGNDLTEEDRAFLEKCFKKTDSENTISSYTGMIEKIVIHDRVCDEYAELFEKLKIGQITFVDTYGLDHHSQEDKDEIKRRMHDLLYTDYEQIKNVLYIRKLSSDSPVDLEYYLPALYQIDSSVVLNMVFTGADKNETFVETYEASEDKCIDLMSMHRKSTSKNSAVGYFEVHKSGSKFSDNKHPLQESICKVVRSEKFAESMFNAIVRRLTPYCACEKREEFQRYFENNNAKLYQLFKAVIDKEYIGNGIIDTKRYETNLKGFAFREDNSIYKVLDKLLTQLFEEASMSWYDGNYHRGHWKTKKANYDRIRNGALGYLGVHDDRWGSQFKDAYNKVFSAMDDNDFIILFQEPRHTSQGITIQHLLNLFNVELIGCEKCGLGRFLEMDCVGCDKMQECFKYKLLEAYGTDELCNGLGEYQSHKNWLNERCNFQQRYQDNKESIMRYVVAKLLLLRVRFSEHNKKNANALLQNSDEITKALENMQQQMKKCFGSDFDECVDFMCEYVDKYLKTQEHGE